MERIKKHELPLHERIKKANDYLSKRTDGLKHYYFKENGLGKAVLVQKYINGR